jgi:hypothetical protein
MCESLPNGMVGNQGKEPVLRLMLMDQIKIGTVDFNG